MSDSIMNKSIADELALLIASNSTDNDLIDVLKSKLAPALRPETEGMDAEMGEAAVTDRIGIWKRELRNGEVFFVRDPEMKDDWTYWSQIPVIAPKTDKKRLIFLGESVARGYLYDPYYNPAKVLQGILDQSGMVNSEVLDLARTNLDLTNLGSLTNECLELKPDAIAVFAGNNWYYSIKRKLTKNDLLLLGEAFEKEGLAKLKELLIGKFREGVKDYLRQLSHISAKYGIPVFFIIPEFNLLDWRSSNNEKILTAIPNSDLQQWNKTREEAEVAMSAGNLETAWQKAQEMIQLDCSHPSGYDIAADVSISRGMNEEARAFLEAARDTSLFNRSYSKPRAFAVIRETILAEAAAMNIHVVDLPAVFKETENGALPGRDLFLDYCHLSEKGIQIAMAATAQSVIRAFTEKSVSIAELNAESFTADDTVRATAFICAAVHNAHYGQTHDMLNYLCSSALKSSPVAAEILTDYVDFASRKTVTTLCRSHEKLVESEYINQYGGGVGFLHKRGQKTMDIALVDAMVASLEEAGVEVSDKVQSLRQVEHGVERNKVINLTESFYSSAAYDIYPGKMPGYYQSRDAVSTFFLVSEKTGPVRAKLTFRTPLRDESSDVVSVCLNNVVVSTYSSGEKWQTAEFVLPQEALIKGINYVTVNWSTRFSFKEGTEEQDVTEDYVLNKLFHVYGEISSFTATVESNN
jgi:hypothetical protein